MTGFTRAEVLGKNPRLLKSGHHSRSFYEDLWEKLLRGEVFRETITDRRKSGEFYLSSQTITPLRSPDGTISHLVSIATDVTERRKAMDLENGLRLARQVQQRLFPPAPPSVPGLDAWGVSIPAHATGGDYFDFLTLPGGALGLVIGDVSGHGFDSAILMAQVRALVRAAARRESDPARILSEVNALLVPDLGENRFIGMIVVAIEPHTRSVTYANAGHTPGYILDQAGHVRMELTSTGVVLGLFCDAAFVTAAGTGTRARRPARAVHRRRDGGRNRGRHGSAAPSGRWTSCARARTTLRPGSSTRSAKLSGPSAGDAAQQDDVTAIVCRVGERANSAMPERRRAARRRVAGPRRRAS